MTKEHADGIKLELEPNPQGDNYFDVDIRQDGTRLTYFASKQEGKFLVDAGFVILVFEDCLASRYRILDLDEEAYIGWCDAGSDFGEIKESAWVSSFPTHIAKKYHHYVFELNSRFFECVAKSFRTEFPIIL